MQLALDEAWQAAAAAATRAARREKRLEVLVRVACRA
jgi:hypothetical protein